MQNSSNMDYTMHIKLGPGALFGFTWKNLCKQPRLSVAKISKLILFRGFQLMSRFKTTKTLEYNRIIILDQESYHDVFLNVILSSNIKFIAKGKKRPKTVFTFT